MTINNRSMVMMASHHKNARHHTVADVFGEEDKEVNPGMMGEVLQHLR